MSRIEDIRREHEGGGFIDANDVGALMAELDRLDELRAPDPTLTAHMASGESYAWRVLVQDRVAHRIADGCDQSGHPEFRMLANMQTEDARWFAVPCRECFPDAPPPGQRTRGGDTPPDDLAWQVRP